MFLNIWDFFGWFTFPKADSQPGWESSWAQNHLDPPTRRGIAQLLRGKGDLLGPTGKRASRKCGNVLLGLSRIDLCTCRSSNTAFSQHSLIIMPRMQRDGQNDELNPNLSAAHWSMFALPNITMMERQFNERNSILISITFFRERRQHLFKMVNVPKARNTYCAKCNKHGKFKVQNSFIQVSSPAGVMNKKMKRERGKKERKKRIGREKERSV